jgi:hypothetical protein
MADSKPLTAITITTATPKIREFVPKGEWREEGLGHYDPLSSHEIDGVRKEKERLTAVTHTTNPTILSSLGESWILDEWLVVGGVEGGNDDRNDDWNGARQRQIAWTTSDS